MIPTVSEMVLPGTETVPPAAETVLPPAETVLPASESLPPTSPTPVSAKSNIGARVVTALIGIPLVLLLVWHANALTFNLVVAIFSLMALRELGDALRRAGYGFANGLAFLTLGVLMGAQQVTSHGGRGGALVVWLLPFVLFFLVSISAVLRYPQMQRLTLESLALTLTATLYVGMFVFVILLRGLGWEAAQQPFDFAPFDRDLVQPPPLGASLLWLTLLGVWSGDTVAYFSGRQFGKEKLTPLSPGKTWEGAVAGLCATIAVCVPVSRLLELQLRDGLALGVIIAIAAPLGDLAESFWKRELQTKDMGGALPGHGGILDRCDSLLFAAFAVYMYAQLVILG